MAATTSDETAFHGFSKGNTLSLCFKTAVFHEGLPLRCAMWSVELSDYPIYNIYLSATPLPLKQLEVFHQPLPHISESGWNREVRVRVDEILKWGLSIDGRAFTITFLGSWDSSVLLVDFDQLRLFFNIAPITLDPTGCLRELVLELVIVQLYNFYTNFIFTINKPTVVTVFPKLDAQSGLLDPLHLIENFKKVRKYFTNLSLLLIQFIYSCSVKPPSR